MLFQHTVFPVAMAQALATKFNDEDDDGWTYAVIIDPKGTGKAVIEVYDAELVRLGLL